MTNDQNKEQYIIGAIFHQESLLPKLADILSPSDFYHTKYQQLFTLLVNAIQDGTPISPTSFDDFGLEIVMAMNVVTSPAHALTYAKEIAGLSRKRKIHQAATGLKETIENDGDVEGAIQTLNQSIASKSTDGATGKNLVESYEAEQQLIAKKLETGESLIGLSSGYTGLDEAIDGIRPGHFWVIGGYTSTGKSYLALNIAKHLITNKNRVLFYSLEMSTEEIGMRLIGLFSGMNSTLALKGTLETEEREQVESAKNEVYMSKIKVFDTKRTLEEIHYSILGENANDPVDCVFIDYLQLLGGKNNESQYDTLRRASAELQSIGKSTKIPIIALSQINNETAKTESQMIGFKGAGDIAASADFGLEMRIDEPNAETLQRKQNKREPVNMKLVIKKNRQGSKKQINLLFDGFTGTFLEVTSLTL